MKTTDIVVFFPAPHNVEGGNANKRVCTAIATGHDGEGRGSNKELDLFVLWAASGYGPMVMPSVSQATSLADALDPGERWTTITQAQLWGIDLSDGDQDIPALLE